MRRLYLHLPRFPVQRAVRDLPGLRHVPLALVQLQRGEQRVAFSSSAGLRAGVQPGMGLAAARAHVPGLETLPFDPAVEARALLALGEALLAWGPAFEPVPPDGLFLDASAAPLCKGGGTPEENLAGRVLSTAQDFGLRGQAVVASRAFPARALARLSGAQVQCVPPGEEAQRLAPLPLSVLEEVAAREVAAFRALGLCTLGEVARLPTPAVLARLGAAGGRAQALCRGEDDTPLHPAALPEEVAEEVALEMPAEQLEPVLFALKAVVDRAVARLQGRGLAAVRLLLQLRLDPSGEADVPLQLARPTGQPRLLLELLRHRLAELQLPRPVAGLRLRVLEAQRDAGRQLELGDGPQGDAPLEAVLSRLATALGEEALVSVSLQARHRPEAAAGVARFRPPVAARGLAAELLPTVAQAGPAPPRAADGPPEAFPAGWEGLRHGLGVAVSAPGQPVSPVVEVPPPEARAAAALGERPARLLPTPLQLEVVLDAQGALASARVGGRQRRVRAAVGPERLCGEWWEERPLQRDYYRVHLEGLGLLWIFREGRDGRFYLHGLFD